MVLAPEGIPKIIPACGLEWNQKELRLHKNGAPGRRAIDERLLFFKQFVVSPRYLGSITPSSHFLVERLIGLANVSGAREVVELGPGTGPFTAGLLSKMPGDSRLLTVERDVDLANHLRARLVDGRLKVLAADAQNLPQLLEENGFDSRVPIIVSGLPFTSLPEGVRERIMRAIVSSLTPDGDFLLYQYSPLMRAQLRRHFHQIESHWEIRNIPPAICMRCRL